MKKILISASAIAAVGIAATIFSSNVSKRATLFDENVEALSACEQHYGRCREKENACMTFCENCGALIIAEGNHVGPAYDITSCNHCAR